ncbi:MAG: tellurite resistance protein TerC [Limisphaerales bacterium]|nr:MAG: tellurite resistance protein TerC [Limisphaerales bacterium]KAG0510728.1 MAG: tellurite resistance protein TerC [Limisphaerales bacterium]TXT52624.1 MAG: tellurite resistance protein TerC [Limisphaerales bacterium]
MLGLIEITPWHYAGFVAAVLVFLALDLGVFHREAHVVKFREALAWTALWFALAMAFAGLIKLNRPQGEAIDFVTGYIIELSLSMDNVFVIALIFTYFRVPLAQQHRVLFWGIMGALIMRGVMIGAGAALIKQFHWLLYVMGGFLVFTGIKMLFVDDDGVHPEKNPAIKLAKKFFPVTHAFDGQKFVTRLDGRTALTPLALVLVMVETTDLIFAVDSIPAIFAVTQNPFIVFTSNVFAILGLRSLYFVLAGAIGFFRYLKVGLSIVLAFIGVKMLLGIWDIQIRSGISLTIVLAIILTSMAASIVVARREGKHLPADDDPDAPPTAPA